MYMYIYNFTFFFWAVLGLCCCADFSLVAVSRAYSLVVVCGLLISMVSQAVEHGLQAHGLQLWCLGLVTPQHVRSSQTRD